MRSIRQSFLPVQCAPAFLLCLFALSLQAASPNADFEQANKLYEQGKFKEAARAYEALADRGIESPTIYFNLGNAWYKAGQNGRAIAAYLHAERLAPRDPNIRFNLGFVRNKVNDGKTGTGTILQRALRHFSLNEWTLATASALWLWLLLLAAGEFRPAWRVSLHTLVLASGLTTAVLAAALLAAFYDHSHVHPAVVVVAEAPVRYGPLEESHTFSTLHDGTEVRILEDQRQNPWLKVQDSIGRAGWLKRDQVLPVFLDRPFPLNSSLNRDLNPSPSQGETQRPPNFGAILAIAVNRGKSR